MIGLTDRWDACSRTIYLQGRPSAFAYRGDTIALGLEHNVVLLDAITGVRTSALHGHADTILSIAFSSDGTLLVSRSKDDVVKLWDIQTGGLIRTFSRLPPFFISATSISPDGASIALGTTSGQIHLWDVRTGKLCLIATYQERQVKVISFSPVDPRRLISSSGGATVLQWDVDGHQIGTSHFDGYRVDDISYALDGTRFVSCGGEAATVRDSESGAMMVKIRAPGPGSLSKCCFSPDGKFVACGGGVTIYVWDITTSQARLVRSLVGHLDSVIFLAFSSSLVSGSLDRSVKFRQSSNLLAESETTGHTAPLSPRDTAQISSVKIFAKDRTIVTSDQSGVVKTWDLITGTCKSSFSTPAGGSHDTHLKGETLIIVWHTRYQYIVWDIYNDKIFLALDSSVADIKDLKISEDGSKIFGLGETYIEVLSTKGAETRRVDLEGRSITNFFVRGWRVGINHSCSMGWDFGASEVPSFGEFPDGPRLDLVDRSRGNVAERRWIEDTVTKKAVFHLPEKYMKPGTKVEWDGQYLFVLSESEEAVVIDFDSVQCALDET